MRKLIIFCICALLVYAIFSLYDSFFVSPSDATPINQKWDIAAKETTFVQDFKLTRNLGYDLFINFAAKYPNRTQAQLAELQDFTGDGSQKLYNLKTQEYMVLHGSEERKQANQMILNGDARWEYANPGTIIPMHLKIEKLDENGSPLTITDQNIDTKGIVGGGLRQIATVLLKPGSYRLSINTLKEVALPANTETFLILRARPNTRELKDDK